MEPTGTIAGPLTWGEVGWDSERPDVVRLVLHEVGGDERVAFLPVEKAALVGAMAAVAKSTAPKPAKRARKGAEKPAKRADVRLFPGASKIVADEGLLRDDVAADLGRASLDGRVRVEMTSGRDPKRTVVFMLISRGRNDVFVWSAAVEGAR